jgi:Holliday junction resolvase RusA-like endonuclease
MLLFEIHGKPLPKKELRFGNGHAYNPNKTEKERIQWQIRPYAPPKLLTGRLEVFYTFYFPIAKSIKGVRRQQMLNDVIGHTQKPDWDNLPKTLTDAMKGIIYDDDCIISDGHIHKRWGEQGKIVVKIVPIASFQKTRGDECA